MTNPQLGHPFWLQPPEHWQDVAKATRENLAAMRKQRKYELETCQGQAEKMQQVNELHDQMESEMMKGYLPQIKKSLKYIEKNPRIKNFRWSMSDPPGTPHVERIDPRINASPHHEAWRQKQQQQQRRHQTFQGRHLRFT